MLILAGVSINALVGDNGVLTQAQYATFLNEMTAVQEAVDMWKASKKIEKLDDNTIPSKGSVTAGSLDGVGRIYGEIAYYRMWAINDEEPTGIDLKSSNENFNSLFEGDIIVIPPRIYEQLYWLDNEALGLKSNKQYIIDAQNSTVYSYRGYNFQGIQVHSIPMVEAVINGRSVTPDFVFAETNIEEKRADNYTSKYELNPDGSYKLDASGNKIENPDFNASGFRFITSTDTTNIYKLYNDGTLYGKGVKGIGLQTPDDKMNEINDRIFQELTIPSEIPSCKEVIPGNGTIFVIDNDDNLWAWGNNSYNKLALTEEQQNVYTEREAVKLNVGGKKVYKVFQSSSNTFVVTKTNSTYELYGAGYNQKNNLGLNHSNVVNEFTKIENVPTPEKIYNIVCDNTDGTFIWINTAPDTVAEKSDAWCAYNSFYYCGNDRWSVGNINNKVPPTYTTFKKVWDGIDGEDYDHLIKEARLASVGPAILTITGEYYQSGYQTGGLGSGGLGGGPTSTNFQKRNDNGTLTFTKMWNGGNVGDGILLQDTSGKLYGLVGGRKDGVFGYDTYNWKLEEIPNVPFSASDLKDVCFTGSNVFYLLNNGKVYATGSYYYMGLGADWASGIAGFKDITAEFPEVNTLQGGSFGSGQTLNKQYWCPNTNIFIGKDKKLYLEGNSTLSFRNDIIEKSWVEIAKNVKDFCAKEIYAYIDFNNDLYVAGGNSLCLGLGGTSDTPEIVKTFTKVTDSKIAGKAIKVDYSPYNVIACLTKGGILYSSGYYTNGGTYFAPGWEDSTITTTQTGWLKVSDNIADFVYNSGSRIMKKTNGEIWTFGSARSWRYTSTSMNTKEKVTGITDNITKMYGFGRHSVLIDDGGNIWGIGDEYGHFWGIASYSSGEYRQFDNTSDKNIIDLQCCGSQSYIMLTDDGKVYGFGPRYKLGIGSISTESNATMIDTGLSDVSYILAGNGYYVAVKNDGTVWGTGSNLYGVLGRWKGEGNKVANSRYKTAFNWVECPELEI